MKYFVHKPILFITKIERTPDIITTLITDNLTDVTDSHAWWRALEVSILWFRNWGYNICNLSTEQFSFSLEICIVDSVYSKDRITKYQNK